MLFPGMTTRMQKEMTALIHEKRSSYEVHVSDCPGGRNSAWIGGSMLASLSTFPNMCITAQEYNETGPHMARRKFF